jgi:hypothetical protein
LVIIVSGIKTQNERCGKHSLNTAKQSAKQKETALLEHIHHIRDDVH